MTKDEAKRLNLALWRKSNEIQYRRNRRLTTLDCAQALGCSLRQKTVRDLVAQIRTYGYSTPEIVGDPIQRKYWDIAQTGDGIPVAYKISITDNGQAWYQVR